MERQLPYNTSYCTRLCTGDASSEYTIAHRQYTSAQLGTQSLKCITEKTGLEPWFYNEFDEASLTDIVRHHEKVIDQPRSDGSHTLFGVLSILDDRAATAVMRNPRGIIDHLAVRGRHYCASLRISSQS